jgi:hypothetical protein
MPKLVYSLIYPSSLSPLTSLYYGFLNKRVRYAIESATARYPIILLKLAMVEAAKGDNPESGARSE